MGSGASGGGEEGDLADGFGDQAAVAGGRGGVLVGPSLDGVVDGAGEGEQQRAGGGEPGCAGEQVVMAGQVGPFVGDQRGLAAGAQLIEQGLARGLSREGAARFAFLLATPVILAAGALKLPDLAGPLGSGIHGQILLASVLSGVGAYLSVRFLVRYLRTRTLTPFGIYCLIAGLGSLAYLTLVK